MKSLDASAAAPRPAWRRCARRVLIALATLLLFAAGVAVWLRTAVELGVTTQPTLPPPATAEAPPGSTRPVVILLHGAGLNGHMWDPALRHLDPRWRYIALDLPAHGSQQTQAFTLDSAVASVARAAQSVAPAPVVLVGDSLGGYVAMAAASALPPQQLRGLVLAGCSKNFRWIDGLRIWLQGTFVRGLIAVSSERQVFARAPARFGLQGDDARHLVEAGLGLRGYEQAVSALLRVDMRARLAAIHQPVLIANGTLDTAAMRQEASFLAVAQQGSSVHFENTEHGISLRRSAEFAAMVNQFAERVFSQLPRP
ncbi:MAG: alpha/beta hydrolase [Rubrivivax sp.]